MAARPLQPGRTAAGEHLQGGRMRPPARGRDVTNSLALHRLATEATDQPTDTVTVPVREHIDSARAQRERAVPGCLRIVGHTTGVAAGATADTAAAVSELPSRPGWAEPRSERASGVHLTAVRPPTPTAWGSRWVIGQRPTRRRLARPGRDTGRQDAAAPAVASERVTARRGHRRASAEHHAGHKAAADRAPRRGRRRGSEGGREATGLNGPGGDKDPRAARATRRQPRRSSRLCRANEGCRERSDRNPKCVTTPYALFDPSHSKRLRASARGACVVGVLGKQVEFSIFATGRRDVRTPRKRGSQRWHRFPVSPVQGGCVLRPMIHVTDADVAKTPEAGLGHISGAGSAASGDAVSVLASGSHGPRQRVVPSKAQPCRSIAATAPASMSGDSRRPPRWVQVFLEEGGVSRGHNLSGGGAASWVGCPRVSAPCRAVGTREGPTTMFHRSGPAAALPGAPKAHHAPAGTEVSSRRGSDTGRPRQRSQGASGGAGADRAAAQPAAATGLNQTVAGRSGVSREGPPAVPLRQQPESSRGGRRRRRAAASRIPGDVTNRRRTVGVGVAAGVGVQTWVRPLLLSRRFTDVQHRFATDPRGMGMAQRRVELVCQLALS